MGIRIIYENNGFPVELSSERQLQSAVATGRLRPDTLVKTPAGDGQLVLCRAEDVPLLRPYFPLPSPGPPLPPEPSPAAGRDDRVPVPGQAAAGGVSAAAQRTAPPASADERSGDVATHPPVHARPSLPAGDGFFDFALLPLRRYAEFTGRSRRREYWSFLLLQLVAIIVGFLLIGESASAPLAVAFVVAMLALVVPNLAVAVRRLHDSDKSGWLLLVYFIPYVGWLVVLVLMLIEGTHGPNRYGGDPKSGNVADIFA